MVVVESDTLREFTSLGLFLMLENPRNQGVAGVFELEAGKPHSQKSTPSLSPLRVPLSDLRLCLQRRPCGALKRGAWRLKGALGTPARPWGICPTLGMPFICLSLSFHICKMAMHKPTRQRSWEDWR